MTGQCKVPTPPKPPAPAVAPAPAPASAAPQYTVNQEIRVYAMTEKQFRVAVGVAVAAILLLTVGVYAAARTTPPVVPRAR